MKWRRSPRALALAALLLLLTSPGWGQVVEEFYASSGGLYGESPTVRGNLVVWQAHGDRSRGIADTIQCRDIGMLGGPVVDMVPYPANTVGVVLSSRYLYFGARGEPIRARPIGPGCALGATETVVYLPYLPAVQSPFAHVVAATDEYVFIRAWIEAPEEPLGGRHVILAQPVERLGDPAALVEVADIGRDPDVTRTDAASERYFVWQEWEGDPLRWQIHVMDITDGIPREPQRVIDTRARSALALSGGVYLDLAGSYLVFQKADDLTRESAWGIYFVDLDSGGEPVQVVRTEDRATAFLWPTISREYVVWTRVLNFFKREAFGMRIVDGVPSGEAFSLGPGGSWIWIDRNLTVANGSTRFVKNNPVHSAIVVRELDLPGATDVGDADSDGRIVVTDAVVILRHLFLGGPRPRLRLADASRDRRLDIGDALIILRYLFLSGERP